MRARLTFALLAMGASGANAASYRAADFFNGASGWNPPVQFHVGLSAADCGAGVTCLLDPSGNGFLMASAAGASWNGVTLPQGRLVAHGASSAFDPIVFVTPPRPIAKATASFTLLAGGTATGTLVNDVSADQPWVVMNVVGSGGPVTLRLPGGQARMAGAWIRASGPYAVAFDLNVSAVPEPASWALMIIGFGVVGLAARRRPSAASA